MNRLAHLVHWVASNPNLVLLLEWVSSASSQDKILKRNPIFSVSSVIGGFLSDRLGRRKPLVIGSGNASSVPCAATLRVWKNNNFTDWL